MRTAVLGLLVCCTLASAYGGVQYSRGRTYYAVVVQQGGARQFPDQNLWRATVYHRSGVLQYQLEQRVPYDLQFPALYLSDDAGQAIVVSTFEARVEFYDGRGNLVRVVHPSASGGPTYERIVKCSVAGSRAALLVSSPDASHAEVFFTAVDGTEMWRRTLPHDTAGELFLASDGTYLVAGCYASDREIVASTVLFDAHGGIVRTLEALFRNADIDPERNILALSSRNELVLESLDGLARRVSWSTARAEEIITGIRLVDGHAAAAVETVDLGSGAPVYARSALVVTDRSGEEVERRVLEGSSSHPAVLEVEEDAIIISSGERTAGIRRDELRDNSGR